MTAKHEPGSKYRYSVRAFMQSKSEEAARELWDMRNSVEEKEAINIRKFFVSMTIPQPTPAMELNVRGEVKQVRELSVAELKLLNQVKRMVDDDRDAGREPH